MFGMRLFNTFPWETRKSIIWRCVFGLGSNICAMGTIWFVPLYISQSILSCTVFVTMLLAWLINNEKISFREILMIIGGVAGVFVLIIPNWIHSKGANPSKKMNEQTLRLLIGIILAMCTITFSGLRSVAIRKIGDNVHSSVKNYYFGLSATIVLLLANVYI